MYRDIGRVVRAGGAVGMRTRAVVPARRKASLTAGVALGLRPRFDGSVSTPWPKVLQEEIAALERSAERMR
jgi:hypothetical protein